jgi:predicted transcriptional regulator
MYSHSEGSLLAAISPATQLLRHNRAVLAITRRQDYIARMDTAPRPGDRADTPSPETEVEQQRRLAWEAERIAEARAELDAGLYVDADEIDAWIDSIGTGHELPPPPTRHR